MQYATVSIADYRKRLVEAAVEGIMTSPPPMILRNPTPPPRDPVEVAKDFDYGSLRLRMQETTPEAKRRFGETAMQSVSDVHPVTFEYLTGRRVHYPRLAAGICDAMSQAGGLLWRADSGRRIRRFGLHFSKGTSYGNSKYTVDAFTTDVRSSDDIPRFRESVFWSIRDTLAVSGTQDDWHLDLKYRLAVLESIRVAVFETEEQALARGAELHRMVFSERGRLTTEGPAELDRELYSKACEELPKIVAAYREYERWRTCVKPPAPE